MDNSLRTCFEKPEAIVVVDNDAVDRRFYSTHFEPFMDISNIFMADDGAAAMELLRIMSDKAGVISSCIVLVELDLPDTGGLNFIKKIRQDEKFNSLTLVVVTNVSNPLRLYQATTYGANLVMSKDRFFRNFNEAFSDILAQMGTTESIEPKQDAIRLL